MVNDRIYLDHAATTRIRPSVVEAYTAALSYVGNPSSQHASGRRVRGILDDAVADIAALLGVPRSWIIMTSGGTESDNLALRGIGGHVVAAATDHPAVVDTVRAIGGELAPVTSTGALDLEALEALVAHSGGEPTRLVSAALVNNETGIIQDLDAVSEIARAHGAVVHTDAVQAMGYVSPPSFEKVQLASITGHKIGAPVGVGLLVADPSVALSPVGTGGGQQRGIRSGTLDAAHAVALAVALRETFEQREAQVYKLRMLEQRLLKGLTRIDPEVHITASGAPHSPHVVHACFEGADQDAVLFVLDQAGIDCSAGSACHAGVTQASHVLEAMGLPESLTRGALRFSFGYSSTESDVDALLEALPRALEAGRAVGRMVVR